MVTIFSPHYFLQEGPFTRVDAQVRVKAKSIKRKLDNGQTSRKTYRGAVSEYIESMRVKEDVSFDDFRKRTASQIIASDYVSGCSDAAILFSALGRALNIPVAYVETFEKSWIDDLSNFGKSEARACTTVNLGQGGISTHSFVDVFNGARWHSYEPKKGFTPAGRYVLNGREYVEVGRGLDFGRLHLKDAMGYRTSPVCLQYFRDAILTIRPDADSLPLYNPLYAPLELMDRVLNKQEG